VGSEYDMAVVPVLTADTRPLDEPMVATEVLLLLHVPPGADSVSGVDEPLHREESPPIVPTGFTVTGCITKQPVSV